MAILVKICGVTSVADAKAAAEAGCDAIGFNFYSMSPRCIAVETAKECAAAFPTNILKVGVFVNHSREDVAAVAQAVGLDALQFSGDEDLKYCSGWQQYKVIKAVRLGSDSVSTTEVQEIARQVDILLFDRFSPEAFGGTGEEIPDDLIQQAPYPQILQSSWFSGGLTVENVQQKIERYRPAGVDVASGVESTPGVKDHEKMRAFVAAARAAQT